MNFLPIVSSIAVILLLELIFSILKDTPLWLLRRALGTTNLLWKELIYLRNILRNHRFSQWNPKNHRYVALGVIKTISIILEDSQLSTRKLHHQHLLNQLINCVQQRESVLVLGDPGGGKTTTIEALTYQLAEVAYRRIKMFWFLWLLGGLLFTFWSYHICIL